MNLLKSVSALSNLFNRKTVDAAIKGVQRSIDRLDAAAEHAVSSKEIIKAAMIDLSNEWDKHNVEHRRAMTVSAKLKGLIS